MVASLVELEVPDASPRLVLLLVLALLTDPRLANASSISSRVLIDPVGEHTGDVFGCSVAWVGDVHEDGYDDVLIGAWSAPP